MLSFSHGQRFMCHKSESAPWSQAVLVRSTQVELSLSNSPSFTATYLFCKMWEHSRGILCAESSPPAQLWWIFYVMIWPRNVHLKIKVLPLTGEAIDCQLAGRW